MKRTWWRAAPLAMVLAVSLLAAACGGSGGTGGGSGGGGSETGQNPAASEPSGGPQKGGVITMAFTDEPDTLDPAHTVSGPAEGVFHYIYDGLVNKTPDGAFEGNLATDWTTSDDAKTWTFHLRQDVKFSNGDPFNADAVVFTFQRIIDPATQAPSKGFLGPVEKVEKVDDYTVQFDLAAPSALLLDNLAIGYFGIVDPKAVEAEGDDYGRNPVGTGPFMLKEWVAGDHLTLVPNPNYQNFRSYVDNKGGPYVDEVQVRIIPQVETQLAAIESGEINVIAGIQGDKADLYSKRPGFQIVTDPYGTGIEFLFFGMEKDGSGTSVYKPPFDDIRVRQAVGYALDVPGMIDAVLHGYGTRDCLPMPTGVFSYDKSLSDSYCFESDPQKAGELLDEAGWKMGSDGVRTKDGKPLEIEYWALDAEKDTAQVVQSQLEAVGFKVDLKALDVTTYVSTIGDSGMTLGMVSVGWPAPNILDIITTLGFGIGIYNANGLPDALAKAGTTTDENARREAYQAAQKILLDDVAVIPLYSPEAIYLATDELKDAHFGPDGHMTLTDVWLAK